MNDFFTKWYYYRNPQETQGNILGHTLSAIVVTSVAAYFLVTAVLITSSIHKEWHAKSCWQGEPDLAQISSKHSTAIVVCSIFLIQTKNWKRI